jgi:hypothetical protein
LFDPLRLAHAHARHAGIVLAAGLACAAAPAVANASTVSLASASPFVVLGASTVTNTGASVLDGDLGLSPGTSLTGFGPPAVVNGATHTADGVAAAAQNDLTTAYGVAAGQPVPLGNDLTGEDLGGLTLTPGAYSFHSSAQLTGRLILDAGGNPNAQFVFEIGSTLTTASGSSVGMINGASPCNVYWQIGSSATLGTTTAFQGNLLAHASITLNHAATVHGRALARVGAVTLDDNTLDASMCDTSSGATPAPVAPPTGSGSPTGTGSGSGSGSSTGTGTTGATSTPAAPVAGMSVTVHPVSGTVQVRRPGGSGFVSLRKASSIPVGTVIDTTHGKVSLTSAVNRTGKTKTGLFTSGRFVVGQANVARPLTELRLAGGSFAACSAPSPLTQRQIVYGSASLRSGELRAFLPRAEGPGAHKVVRKLWGQDNGGKFRTIGRSASAAVRGTIWLTEDRCDGTLIRVDRGRVLVHVPGRRHDLLISAGHSYLARAHR